VTPYSLLDLYRSFGGTFCLHDDGSMFLRNVSIYVPNYQCIVSRKEVVSPVRTAELWTCLKSHFVYKISVFHCSVCKSCSGLNVASRSLEGRQHSYGGKCLHLYLTVRHYFPKFPNLKAFCLRQPILLSKLRADIPRIKQ